jgi:hypothetical protein
MERNVRIRLTRIGLSEKAVFCKLFPLNSLRLGFDGNVAIGLSKLRLRFHLVQVKAQYGPRQSKKHRH